VITTLCPRGLYPKKSMREEYARRVYKESIQGENVVIVCEGVS
jgi:hypothetical protein